MTLRILALLALVAALGACSRGGSNATTAPGTVARVADGDTIVLADGGRVRLVQLDAPEQGEGECYAFEAARELERLLSPGSTVELETDPALDRRDENGRLLAYVFRENENVNLELVERGAASPYFYRGERGRYADELLAAARRAQGERRGLWGACPGTRLVPTRRIEALP